VRYNKVAPDESKLSEGRTFEVTNPVMVARAGNNPLFPAFLATATPPAVSTVTKAHIEVAERAVEAYASRTNWALPAHPAHAIVASALQIQRMYVAQIAALAVAGKAGDSIWDLYHLLEPEAVVGPPTTQVKTSFLKTYLMNNVFKHLEGDQLVQYARKQVETKSDRQATAAIRPEPIRFEWEKQISLIIWLVADYCMANLNLEAEFARQPQHAEALKEVWKSGFKIPGLTFENDEQWRVEMFGRETSEASRATTKWSHLIRLSVFGRRLVSEFLADWTKGAELPGEKISDPLWEQSIIVLNAHRDVVAEHGFSDFRGGFYQANRSGLDDPKKFHDQLYCTPSGIVEYFGNQGAHYPNLGYAVNSPAGDGQIRIMPVTTEKGTSLLLVRSCGVTADGINPVADALMKNLYFRARANGNPYLLGGNDLEDACVDVNSDLKSHPEFGKLGADAFVVCINHHTGVGSGEALNKNLYYRPTVSQRADDMLSSITTGRDALYASSIGQFPVGLVVGIPEDQYTPRGTLQTKQLNKETGPSFISRRAAGFQTHWMLTAKGKTDCFLVNHRFVIAVSPGVKMAVSDTEIFEIANQFRAHPTDEIARQILKGAMDKGADLNHSYAIVARTHALPGSMYEQMTTCGLGFSSRVKDSPPAPYRSTSHDIVARAHRPGESTHPWWTVPVGPNTLAAPFGNFVAARSSSFVTYLASHRVLGIAVSAIKAAQFYDVDQTDPTKVTPLAIPPNPRMSNTPMLMVPWNTSSVSIHGSGGDGFRVGVVGTSIYVTQSSPTDGNNAEHLASRMSCPEGYFPTNQRALMKVDGRKLMELRRVFVSFMSVPDITEKMTVTAIDLLAQDKKYAAVGIGDFVVANLTSSRKVGAGTSTYLGEDSVRGYGYPKDTDVWRADATLSDNQVLAVLPRSTFERLGSVAGLSAKVQELARSPLSSSRSNVAAQVLGTPTAESDGLVLIQRTVKR
jgi:hypothetical protein